MSVARRPGSAKGTSAMNVLLVGSGGREHALAWALAKCPLLTKLYSAPGNPGSRTCRVVALDPATTAPGQVCRRHAIDFAVIAPEAPLVDGLADDWKRRASASWARAPGPARRLQGLHKNLCERQGIPTAATTALTAAADAAKRFGLPVVIKADGLAAGKGVIIAEARRSQAASTSCSKAVSGERPRHRDRGIHGGRRGQLLRSERRQTMIPFGRRRITSASATAIPVPIPAAWAPTARRRFSRRRWKRGDGAIHPPTVGDEAKGMPYMGVLYPG